MHLPSGRLHHCRCRCRQHATECPMDHSLRLRLMIPLQMMRKATNGSTYLLQALRYVKDKTKGERERLGGWSSLVTKTFPFKWNCQQIRLQSERPSWVWKRPHCSTKKCEIVRDWKVKECGQLCGQGTSWSSRPPSRLCSAQRCDRASLKTLHIPPLFLW